MTEANNTLRSRILKTAEINWKSLQFIQQDGFKEHTEVDKSKLKQSLLENGFADAFNVWEDADGTLWCLDGYHRKHDLVELENEGVTIPATLPALFIDCKDKQEAAALVLIFSSRYAKITTNGLHDFMSIYDLNLDADIFKSISLAELEDLDSLKPLPFPGELIAESKNKPASLKVTFANPAQLESAEPVIAELLKTQFPDAYYSVSCGEI